MMAHESRAGARAHGAGAVVALALVMGACSDGGESQAVLDELDDAQLESFAVAEQEVLELQEDYSARIDDPGEAPDDAAALEAETQRAMVAAVEDAGLSVGEYTRIAQAADRDPEVRARLEALSR
ncbi:MAG: DUF4168 domain-containing protein [Halofilum sp. (in: g-proteobacteria)]|nr:DUF4168 domain-containing protein [Halofilum sp. (in: g-proteobacteria)]